MTEKRAISKAETTGMTLEDVLWNLSFKHDNRQCSINNGQCDNFEFCYECTADYIRKNWERLK